jgi:hypothetical protein
MKRRYLILAIILTFVFFSVLTGEIVRRYRFKMGCEDWLKLASETMDIYQAKEFLAKGIKYLEHKNLTTVNSAYFLKSPSADLGLWYQRLKRGEELLAEVIRRKEKGEATPLEISNTLIKLKEFLVDVKEKETVVTLPTKIWLFPNQIIFLISYLISGTGSLIFWISWIVSINQKR